MFDISQFRPTNTAEQYADSEICHDLTHWSLCVLHISINTVQTVRSTTTPIAFPQIPTPRPNVKSFTVRVREVPD